MESQGNQVLVPSLGVLLTLVMAAGSPAQPPVGPSGCVDAKGMPCQLPHAGNIDQLLREAADNISMVQRLLSSWQGELSTFGCPGRSNAPAARQTARAMISEQSRLSSYNRSGAHRSASPGKTRQLADQQTKVVGLFQQVGGVLDAYIARQSSCGAGSSGGSSSSRPSSPQTRTSAGTQYRSTPSTPAARRERALELNRQGLAAWNRDDDEAAMRLFAEAYSLQTQDKVIQWNLALARNQLGVAAYNRDEWATAERLFQRALATYPPTKAWRSRKEMERSRRQVETTQSNLANARAKLAETAERQKLAAARTEMNVILDDLETRVATSASEASSSSANGGLQFMAVPGSAESDPAEAQRDELELPIEWKVAESKDPDLVGESRRGPALDDNGGGTPYEEATAILRLQGGAAELVEDVRDANTRDRQRGSGLTRDVYDTVGQGGPGLGEGIGSKLQQLEGAGVVDLRDLGTSDAPDRVRESAEWKELDRRETAARMKLARSAAELEFLERRYHEQKDDLGPEEKGRQAIEIVELKQKVYVEKQVVLKVESEKKQLVSVMAPSFGETSDAPGDQPDKGVQAEENGEPKNADEPEEEDQLKRDEDG